VRADAGERWPAVLSDRVVDLPVRGRIGGGGALGRSPAFVEELVHRLSVHNKSNGVRILLLKILTLLYEQLK